MRNHIYKKLVLAETMLSRRVMKGYKAQIRAQNMPLVAPPPKMGG